MKYIAIPETLSPLGHAFPFVDYVRFLTENHAAFDATAAGIRASMRIQCAARQFEDVAGPATMRLDMADYELLAQANAAPTGGYPVLRGVSEDGQPIARPIAKLLLPYIEAIEKAVDERHQSITDAKAAE